MRPLWFALLLWTSSVGVALADEGDEDGPWELLTDTLFYTDTDNVLVVTPQVGAAYSLDDEGGRVGARVALDIISAASVDVVSQATNRFDEVRTEAAFDVSKSIHGVVPSASYRYSQEPDFVSHGGRLGVTLPLRGKDSTLAAGYGLTSDRVGRSGTPWSLFSESATTHTGDVSFTQVLGPRTLLRFAYTLTAQSGYLEKPYRTVPLFTSAGLDAAAMDGVRLDLDTFADYSLASRPPESVPDSRWRHALAGRFMRYIPSWRAAVRMDAQGYRDSWGLWAVIAEPSLDISLPHRLRARGFVRLYQQGSADFWKRTYTVGAAGEIPRWRTVDRSLSRYLSTTGGGRVEWGFASFSLYGDVAAMWTRFDDFLFLDNRLALLAQLGLRWHP